MCCTATSLTMRGKPKTESENISGPFTALRPADAPGKAQSCQNLVFNANEKHGIRLGRKQNTSTLTDVKEETDETKHTYRLQC